MDDQEMFQTPGCAWPSPGCCRHHWVNQQLEHYLFIHLLSLCDYNFEINKSTFKISIYKNTYVFIPPVFFKRKGCQAVTLVLRQSLGCPSPTRKCQAPTSAACTSLTLDILFNKLNNRTSLGACTEFLLPGLSPCPAAAIWGIWK